MTVLGKYQIPMIIMTNRLNKHSDIDIEPEFVGVLAHDKPSHYIY